jgi:hypothetical protein
MNIMRGEIWPNNLQYNAAMDRVRQKEKQAEMLAHLLDDAVHIPGTAIRFGLDPIIGLIPVAGDILTVLCGSFIMLTARQLGVPAKDLTRMTYYQLINGLIGAIPVLGDLYSFGFKSHAKNSAILVRALKQGEGPTCQIVVPSLSLLDIGLVCVLTAPIALLAGFVGWWLWERDLSLISFFF